MVDVAVCSCSVVTMHDGGGDTLLTVSALDDIDCPTHFRWPICPGLVGPCGQPTLHDGRHVVRTWLGQGTEIVGRLCPACSADSRDIDEGAR